MDENLVWLAFLSAAILVSLPVVFQTIFRKFRNRHTPLSTREDVRLSSRTTYAKFAFSSEGSGRFELPPPTGKVAVARLSVSYQNLKRHGNIQPVLRNISFEISPGTALGVIGVSGSGKTALCNALVGVLKPIAGTIRLDDAEISHYSLKQRNEFIGFLPSERVLFHGTITENISSFRGDLTDKDILEAAHRVGAHKLIMQFPDGYDTVIKPGWLSGGQSQSIELARAVVGNPKLIVLDEPDSNLDKGKSRFPQPLHCEVEGKWHHSNYCCAPSIVHSRVRQDSPASEWRNCQIWPERRSDT